MFPNKRMSGFQLSSLRSRLLKIFLGNMFLIVTAFTVMSIFNHNRNTEQIIQNHSSWLQVYTESFLNDLLIGNTLSVQKRLDILVEGKYFTYSKIDFGKTTFSSQRKRQGNSVGFFNKMILKVMPLKTITLPVVDSFKTQWGILTVEMDGEVLSKPLFDLVRDLVIFLGSYFFVMIGVLLLGIEGESENVVNLIKSIKKLVSGSKEVDINSFKIKEWADIYNEFVYTLEQRAELQKQLQKAELEVNIGKIGRQVAHDIRSPLEVLKGIKDDFLSFPEEHRRRFQMSVNRIEEIAYKLLKIHKESSGVSNDLGNRSEELLSLLESIIFEKKFEHSAHGFIEINGQFDLHSYGLFSRVRRGTLKVVISNMINNSVEAIKHNKGHIHLKLYEEGKNNIIEISDNGPGIHDDIRGKIFKKGFTSKECGNGLGLSGAKEEISSAGGDIKFDTIAGAGTCFKIILPASEAPPSFVECIDVYMFQKIIILDDDPSFHEVWVKKLDITKDRIESFYSVQDIYKKYVELPPNTLLLSDFELMDEYDGIDAILHFKKVNESILVTARSEEIAIQERCLREGIKLLSKGVINYVKVNQDRPCMVLIDDDKLMRIHWKDFFDKRGVTIKCYSSIGQFLKDADSVSKDSHIYIDSDLGEGVKGEIESETIYNLGFCNLFISTGFEKSSIEKPIWIKDICSKNPRNL